MKAIVCELCGSNELIKTDSVFVCQHCGTKYSLEEAKKLLVEITEPVTVKIEKPAVDEYIYKAKQAIKSGMDDAAKKYIEDAFDIDPMNCQVVLLKAIFKGDSYYIQDAFKFLQSNNRDNAVNEIVSVWNDAQNACRIRGVEHLFWDAFATVFPEQKSIICKYGVPVWKRYFEQGLMVDCDKSEEWSIYRAPVTYDRCMNRYNAIKRYDPSYYNNIFENAVNERNSIIKKGMEEANRQNSSKSIWSKLFG